MSNYQSLLTLKKTIIQNNSVIENILSLSKEKFSSREDLITIAIGLIGEIREITVTLDNNDAILLSSKLNELINYIKEYGANLFTHYKIVNAYKLYDFIKIDLQKLKDFLINTLGE